MFVQPINKSPQSAHVVVLGNEKGGSGKSTTALHIAVALLKAGQRVATIDLDSRQQSFTHYIDNRRAWAERARIKLELPTHYCVPRAESSSVEANEAHEFASFSQAISKIEHSHDVVIIDTPGNDTYLMRLAHSMADTLVTPLNDSFVDFDVLATLDQTNFTVTGESHYAEYGARGAPPAPPGRRPAHRLDRGAQPPLDARLAQQEAGRRGHRRTCPSAWASAASTALRSGWSIANSSRAA